MGSDMAQVSTEEVPGTGSALAAKGAYVLKLNVAGSGDKAWRKYDKDTKEKTLVGDVWRSTVGKDVNKATDTEISEKYGKKDSEDENVFVKYKKVIQNTNGETVSDNNDYNYKKETISVAGPLGWGDLAILVATQFKTM